MEKEEDKKIKREREGAIEEREGYINNNKNQFIIQNNSTVTLKTKTDKIRHSLINNIMGKWE